MHMLLLSWGASALPAFLEEAGIGEPGNGGKGCRIGYISEAVRLDGDADWTHAESDRLKEMGYELAMIPVTGRSREEIEADFSTIDALYVCGGNTFVLLEGLRATGADSLILDRVRGGLPYIGLSAGSVICGSSIEPIRLMDPADQAPNLASTEGLGFVPEVIIPHADGTIDAFPVELIERIHAEYADKFQLRNVNNNQALKVTDQGVELIVSE